MYYTDFGMKGVRQDPRNRVSVVIHFLWQDGCLDNYSSVRFSLAKWGEWYYTDWSMVL